MRAFLCAFALVATAVGAQSPQAAVTPQELAAYVRFLSHDLLEGRAPGSKGSQVARLYLASLLASWGFRGAGDGFVQEFPMVGITTLAPENWRFAHGQRSIALQFAEDFIAVSGVQRETAGLQGAELVFVGYGIKAPEYQWDDFKDFDCRGKVLVFLNNDPDWDPQLFAGPTRLYYGRWSYKYEMAAELGAAGAVIIHTTPSAGYPWPVVVNSWTGTQFELPQGSEPRIQVKGWITEPAAKKLFALAGLDLAKLVEKAKSRDFRPVPTGIVTSLNLQNRLSQVTGANILGILPGSDPTKAQEFVVVSAHYDHLGIGRPDHRGDVIYNGARDNAAGCAQVLAIARALAALPTRPARSILVAFFDAEESGLLGSAYLASHMPVPPGRVAAVVNYDGGNIFGKTRDVAQVGRGKSSLDRILDQQAARQGRVVIPDPFPDRGSFYRSDHFSLARVGIPGLYFKAGVEFLGRPEGWGRAQAEAWEAQHYHRPSDELTADWDFSGLVEDAELGLACVVAIANEEELPFWYEGDEFAPARAKALAELGEAEER